MGEESHQEPITSEREGNPYAGTEAPVDSSGAGEDTPPPQSECLTALPMSRAARAAADMGRAGVELSDLSNCKGSLILIPGECLVCISHWDLRILCSGWPS